MQKELSLSKKKKRDKPFKKLLLRVRIEGPIVVNIVPNMPRKVVGLILDETHGRQDGHDQLLVLFL